ncbi:MAG: sugar phosphate isomerase/epimerase family protein [Pirellulaceae bacterium]
MFGFPPAQLTSLAILALALAPSGAAARDPSHQDRLHSRPFFAFDNGTGRGVLSGPEQARLLADLGYDGIGYTGCQHIPDMLQALDAHGLKMFSIYVAAQVGDGGPTYDADLPGAIKALAGRDTLIWLTVQGQINDHDQQAVKIVQQVADLAQESGLRVALYPHVGFYVASTDDALRIVKKAERKNLGVSFNLCHSLQLGHESRIPEILRQALPYLYVVSINGADHEGGWDRLIQTLDRGEYDVFALLALLDDLAYQGPIGLQCYNIPGDVRVNLAKSMDAWKQFCSHARQSVGIPRPDKERPATSR